MLCYGRRAADAVTFKVTDDEGGAEDMSFYYAVKDDGTIKKTRKKQNSSLGCKNAQDHKAWRTFMETF